MQHESLKIEIDGSEVDDTLYGDLVNLEVELDDELAGMFRMKLSLMLQADGTWKHLEDDALAIWKPVVITAGLEDDPQELLKAYITRVRPEFGAGIDASS